MEQIFQQQSDEADRGRSERHRFHGKTHALAWRDVKAVMGGLPDVRLVALCDTPPEQAARLAEQFGFERATESRWAHVRDPSIDVVSITAPNRLHKAMPREALAQSAWEGEQISL